jgi:hypothetical protein
MIRNFVRVTFQDGTVKDFDTPVTYIREYGISLGTFIYAHNGFSHGRLKRVVVADPNSGPGPSDGIPVSCDGEVYPIPR